MGVRLAFALLVAVLVSALAVVSSNHGARKLVGALEREQERARALEVEWGQLQLEQSTWAAHARVEQIARSQLGMHPPRADRILGPAQ
ncbi:MAG: cell division protein FtsL [Sulfuritalea sp.]|nr:cell division protein FtsL [Sulfuritalea sp.]